MSILLPETRKDVEQHDPRGMRITQAGRPCQRRLRHRAGLQGHAGTVKKLHYGLDPSSELRRLGRRLVQERARLLSSGGGLLELPALMGFLKSFERDIKRLAPWLCE